MPYSWIRLTYSLANAIWDPIRNKQHRGHTPSSTGASMHFQPWFSRRHVLQHCPPRESAGELSKFPHGTPLKKDTFASRFWMTKWHCRMRKWHFMTFCWYPSHTYSYTHFPLSCPRLFRFNDCNMIQFASSATRGSNIVVKTFSNHLQPSTPLQKTLMPLSCPLSR